MEEASEKEEEGEEVSEAEEEGKVVLEAEEEVEEVSEEEESEVVLGAEEEGGEVLEAEEGEGEKPLEIEELEIEESVEQQLEESAAVGTSLVEEEEIEVNATLDEGVDLREEIPTGGEVSSAEEIEGVDLDLETEKAISELHSIEESEKAHEMVETIEDDLGKMATEPRSVEDSLPELEKLVEADTEYQEFVIEGGEEQIINTDYEEEAPPTVPDKIYLEKEGVDRDDELSHLIDRIDERAPESSFDNQQLNKLLGDILDNFGNSRGAILLKNDAGTFSPAVISGLNLNTKNKLTFTSWENIIKNILQKRKILYVKENAFISEALKDKFDPADSGEIRQLLFVPVTVSGEVKGIVTVGVMSDEKFEENIIIKKVKSIKEQIIKLL